jgi:hypothetical protein
VAKPSERMLYQTFLDLWYAEQDYRMYVEEMTETLKAMKKSLSKTEKLLTASKVHYKEVYGSEPTSPKRG